MSDWRDDLPPIPAERIRVDVIREGNRRRERRRQRQRAVLYGAMGAAAISLIVVAGLSIDLGTGGDDDDAATEATEATEPEGTEPVSDTTAAAGAETTAPTEDTGAAETTMVPHTTVGGPIAGLRPSPDVSVEPTTLSEQGSTPSACGPSSVRVTYRPSILPLRAPVVHWETAGVLGQSPMAVAGDVATATVGSFPSGTLDAGAVHELLVWVTDTDAAGTQHVFRAPRVLLRDCAR